MKIIEIAELLNGGHRNQTWSGELWEIPDGWALIPEDMEIPATFPFVSIETEELMCDRNNGAYNPNGNSETAGDIQPEQYPVMTVISMTAGVMPEPTPEPEPEPTQLDRVEAQTTYTAMMTDTLLEV